MSPVLIKFLKVTGYVLVSALIAVLASPEFREIVADYPWVVALVPTINIILAVILKWVQGKLPEDSNLAKVI